MRAKGNHSQYERDFFKFIRTQPVVTIPTAEVKKCIDREGNPLKNFDFLLLSKNIIVADLKGKQFGFKSARFNLFENWVLAEDGDSLQKWRETFKDSKANVTPLLIYMFKINFPGDESHFKDVVKIGRITYGLVAITIDNYLKHSKVRSANPPAISVSRRVFKEIAKPLSTFIPELEF